MTTRLHRLTLFAVTLLTSFGVSNLFAYLVLSGSWLDNMPGTIALALIGVIPIIAVLRIGTKLSQLAHRLVDTVTKGGTANDD